MIYDVMSENPLLKSTELLPPVRFIHILDVDEDKAVKDQVKVIRRSAVYVK